MHVVEVRRSAADLGSAMAQMRTWVDHHRIEPSTFEVAFVSGGEVRFCIQFRDLADAAGFARAFDGEVSLKTANTMVAA